MLAKAWPLLMALLALAIAGALALSYQNGAFDSWLNKRLVVPQEMSEREYQEFLCYRQDQPGVLRSRHGISEECLDLYLEQKEVEESEEGGE